MVDLSKAISHKRYKIRSRVQLKEILSVESNGTTLSDPYMSDSGISFPGEFFVCFNHMSHNLSWLHTVSRQLLKVRYALRYHLLSYRWIFWSKHAYSYTSNDLLAVLLKSEESPFATAELKTTVTANDVYSRNVVWKRLQRKRTVSLSQILSRRYTCIERHSFIQGVATLDKSVAQGSGRPTAINCQWANITP